jgi:ubiquinone biosynthesis O-methyltransferase
MSMFYRVEYSCNDDSQMQKTLNEIYMYKDDLSTKVHHKKRLNLIYDLLVDLKTGNSFPSMESALDIGCNMGLCSKMISDFGFKEVLGIDIDEEYINHAKRRFEFSNGTRLEFKCMYAEKLSEMNKKFDLILCTEVIEHTQEPDKVIESIKNMLTPGGIAIVSLPNKINLNFLTAVTAKKIAGKTIDENLRMHIQYPYYKSLALFESNDIRLKKTSGANFMLLDPLLPLITKLPFFSAINKFDSAISKLYPAKYFSQFFFMILKKNDVR